MRIVINAFSAKLGGGQTYLKQLLAHLPETQKLDIVLFAPKSLVTTEGPRIRRPDVKWPVDNPMLRALWERFFLPGILKRENAEILFCPGGLVTTPTPERCQTATMFRNMIPFTPELVRAMPWGLQRLRNILLRRLMLKSMAKADLTIFISEFAKSVILANGTVRNAVTIPHGISDAFRTADRQLPRPDTAPAESYLLYVSRFDIYKHHREVVLGYAGLPQGLRDAHPLILIGETNLPEASAVAALIDELGLGNNIRILGAVAYAKLPAWYRHAKATIFASSCENCPNIMLEALGAGRPVLSSDIDPMPEFGGKDILYFSPHDPASITAAVMKVLTSDVVERQQAEAASRQSLNYDWSTSAKKTWEALGALCSGEKLV